MIISLYLQIRLVVFSIVAGILTGFFFDLYRVVRGFENVHKIIIVVEDIMFWIFSAIIIFIFLLYTNYALIGVYVYLYIIIGIYIYLKLMSRFFLIMHSKAIYFICKIGRIILNLITYPLKLLFYSINSKNKKKF